MVPHEVIVTLDFGCPAAVPVSSIFLATSPRIYGFIRVYNVRNVYERSKPADAPVEDLV